MGFDTLMNVINQMQENIAENREYLSDLDRAIGDGDHGINMDRGFREVMKKIESSSINTPADLLRTVGMTLAFKVGGAAGPLYGTAFMKASEAVKGKETVLLDDLSPMLENAIEGIQLRGKAVRGEKTMLDALIPAKEALDQALAEGLSGDDALDAMIKAAEEGAEYTKTIIATKGRASYVGERSIGHMDPGAASSCLLLSAIKTHA